MKLYGRLCTLCAVCFMLVIIHILRARTEIQQLLLQRIKAKKFDFQNDHLPPHIVGFPVSLPNYLDDIDMNQAEWIKNRETSAYGQCLQINPPEVEADIDTHLILEEVQTDEKWLDYFKKLNNPLQNSSDLSQPLDVIVCPFSHNDPGWLKSVDEYFEDETCHILDNMVSKLTKYPDMTFVWFETVLLAMWWEKRNESVHSQVRRLIERGQLEISIGSWVMPDEANTHYFALIDQMIEGHSWLTEHVTSIKPETTWSVDPFGCSSTMAYLNKKAGFKNMMILRVHELVKSKLKDRQALQFYWRQEWDTSGDLDIPTYLMPSYLYEVSYACGPAQKICAQFDFSNKGAESAKFHNVFVESVTASNVHERATTLLEQYHAKAYTFKTNSVVFIPIGSDFKFVSEEEWEWQYGNYSRLFSYINNNEKWGATIRFGTPTDYFNILKKRYNERKIYPTLVGDFFPYVDDTQYHWVGFFSTREICKVMSREVEVHLRAAEILFSFCSALSKRQSSKTNWLSKIQYKLSLARRELALFQHHDSITGTSREQPTRHSLRRLEDGLISAKAVIVNSTCYILGLPQSEKLQLKSPKFLGMTRADAQTITVSQTGTKLIIFNNKLSSREEVVRLKVTCFTVVVRDVDNKVIQSQTNPVLTDGVILYGVFELIFIVQLSPLGLQTYYLHKVSETTYRQSNHPASVSVANTRISPTLKKWFHVKIIEDSIVNQTLENHYFLLEFSVQTGMLISVVLKHSKIHIPAKLSFMSYLNSRGGAYVFWPREKSNNVTFSGKPSVYIYEGVVTTEVHVIHKTITHVVALVKTTGLLGLAIEINNVVHLKSKATEETVLRFESELSVGNHFYTDLNGFKVVKRKAHRNVSIQSNYYPMSVFAFIQDNNVRCSVISAQPVGVTSHVDGGLEIMLHRQVLSDDYRGMSELVIDTVPTPSRFYLMFEEMHFRKHKNNQRHRPTAAAHHLADHIRNYPMVLFAKLSSKQSASKVTLGARSLPCDMQMVNLRSLANHRDTRSGGNTVSAALILHRVSAECGPYTHLLRRELDCDFSADGYVSPSEMFKGITVDNVTVKSLSLMYDLGHILSGGRVKIEPMEIVVLNITHR